MQFSISARHKNLSPELREYIITRVEKLGRFFDRIIDGRAILDARGDHQLVEVEVGVGRGVRLVAKVTHEDVYAAVDLAVDKMERQLNRHKEKLKNHRHRRGLAPAEGSPEEER